jgi:hypothetical protein
LNIQSDREPHSAGNNEARNGGRSWLHPDFDPLCLQPRGVAAPPENRTYLGEIPHKGPSYPGRHDAIIDRQTFDAARALLASNSRRRREHVSRADRMVLEGLVFDADGQPMVPVIAGARKRPYRYYASTPLIRGDMDILRYADRLREARRDPRRSPFQRG